MSGPPNFKRVSVVSWPRSADGQPFTVTLTAEDTVGAVAYTAAGRASLDTTLILAHGAGAPQT